MKKMWCNVCEFGGRDCLCVQIDAGDILVIRWKV